MYSAYSLKKRLIVYVSVVSVILGCTLIFAAYRIALQETNEILDAQMQNLAERVANHDPSPIKSKIDIQKRYHEEDLFVDVWAYHSKSHMNHEFGLLVKPVAKAGFYKHQTNNGIWYTYILPLKDYQIQVSQQKLVRQHLALELAANMFIPYVLFLPFVIFALVWGINRNLKPLKDFKDELAKRDANELEHIKMNHYPDEILPTIKEINYLFDRISLAQYEQKQFIADAAHELRTPLTALNLQVKILQQQRLDDPAIHNLSKGLDRVQHLVVQLLSLAKQDASLTESEIFQEVDVNEVAANCVEQLIQFALIKEIDLGVEQQQPIKLHALESSIHSIIYNLIDNAIKYTPKGGIINVVLLREENQAIIIVEDSGMGIDPSLYDKLTKRFYRTQNHDEIGSGLGLSIVIKAVEKHKGELKFSKSESLGGLKVQVTLFSRK